MFGTQFANFAHAPERTITFFVRLKAEITDRMASSADYLESFARGRNPFKDSGLAVEQFSQVVTADCLIDFIHISHLFPFSVLNNDLAVIHTFHLQGENRRPHSQTCQVVDTKSYSQPRLEKLTRGFGVSCPTGLIQKSRRRAARTRAARPCAYSCLRQKMETTPSTLLARVRPRFAN